MMNSLKKKAILICIILISVISLFGRVPVFDDMFKEIDTEDYLKAYDMDWVEWIENPTTEQEIYNNFFYSFVRGQWEFSSFQKNGWSSSHKGWTFSAAAHERCELLSVFLNQNTTLCYSNGDFYVVTNGIDSIFTKDEIMHQLISAYEKAKEIYNQLHDSKAVKRNMNQYQVAKEYVKYLKSITYEKTPQNQIEEASKAPGANRDEIRRQYMKYDTAYACLINKCGDCGSRASAFNLLMHLEDVQSTGYSLKGHIISYTKLDGKFYSVDWQNQEGIIDPKEQEKFGLIEEAQKSEYSIEYAKERKFGTAEKAVILPQLKWEFVQEKGKNKEYRVQVIDTAYEEKDTDLFYVCYGTPNNAVRSGKYSYSELKNGIVIQVSKSSIKDIA